jgi:hypothetical protein
MFITAISAKVSDSISPRILNSPIHLTNITGCLFLMSHLALIDDSGEIHDYGKCGVTTGSRGAELQDP